MKSVLACVFAALLVACSGSGDAAAPRVTLDASVASTAPAPTEAPAPTDTAPTTRLAAAPTSVTLGDAEEEDDSVAAASTPRVEGSGGTEVVADDFLSFSTPTGNITCTVAAETFCHISDKEWEIDQPADCQDDYGNVVFVSTSGPSFGCSTDLFGDPNAEPLAYGSTATIGEMRCDVEQTGVTCQNGSGQGFRIARAAVQLF